MIMRPRINIQSIRKEIEMYRNELAFKNHEDGFKVAQALLNEGYVVMLSYEEQLLILNYEWSAADANRNDVIFMNRWEFEEKYIPIEEEDNICE